MKFTLIKPATAIDPRFTKFADIAEFNRAMGAADAFEVPCSNERDAVVAARQLYGDSVAMPFKVSVGSGSVWLLGFVEDSSLINPDAPLPFVMFVHAITEHKDRRFQKGAPSNPFTREAWKVPVIDPTNTDGETRDPDIRGPFVVHDVEVKSPGVEVPQRVKLTSFGRENFYTHSDLGEGDHKRTHLVLYMEIGGVPMSIEFADPSIRLG